MNYLNSQHGEQSVEHEYHSSSSDIMSKNIGLAGKVQENRQRPEANILFQKLVDEFGGRIGEHLILAVTAAINLVGG